MLSDQENNIFSVTEEIDVLLCWITQCNDE